MERPFHIVELVGPAGSGKSTVAKALCDSDEKIRMGAFPDIRIIKNSPFFSWNIIWLLPVFLRCYRDDKTLTLRQMAMMAILKGWRQRLRRAGSMDGDVVILDQGPVYMMSELQQFGPENLHMTVPGWWAQTCRDWADTLNLVVRLDAPDEVLMDRARLREKHHGHMKNTDEVAMQFLARCRIIQDEILASMSGNCGGPRVVCFDTSETSLNDMIETVHVLFRT